MKRLTLSILSALCVTLVFPIAFANYDLLTLVIIQDDLGVQEALTAGADVNMRDDYGNTPLTTAAIYSNDATLFKILLAAGADIEARDARGLTPLLIAIDSVLFGHDDDLERIQVLLDASANPNARDTGQTAWHGTYDLTPLDFSILGQDDPEASASPLGNFNETMRLLREAVGP